MDIQVKDLPKSELQITITLTDKELAKYEGEAVKRISERIDIPGFRKGQAPKAFVVSKVGADAFFEEVMNIALPHTFYNAVKERDLQVISQPKVRLISREPVSYEARCAKLPEITIKNLDKMKVPAKEVKIDEKDIDEVVREMQKYRATFKPLGREVKKGDKVEIDFQGFDGGGAPLDATGSKNHPLFVGDGTMVAEFEDGLLGMKAGEKKKFPVKFPKDFHHQPLRGKEVHFEVEVKKAEEVILPEVTEDFVEQIMGVRKPIADFRKAIETDLQARKSMEQRRDRENELLEKLLKDAKFEVPPLLIEEEVAYMMGDLKRALEQKGLKFEAYIEQMRKEKRDLEKEYEKEADKRIRIRLILNYLFRTMEISVSEEEMKLALERLSARAPDTEKKALQEQMAGKGEIYLRLQNNIMLEKLFVKLLG